MFPISIWSFYQPWPKEHVALVFQTMICFYNTKLKPHIVQPKLYLKLALPAQRQNWKSISNFRHENKGEMKFCCQKFKLKEGG
jgi:hypothetical protein